MNFIAKNIFLPIPLIPGIREFGQKGRSRFTHTLYNSQRLLLEVVKGEFGAERESSSTKFM